MKHFPLLQAAAAAILLLTTATTATAQVKVGSNPTTINTNTDLEIEATDGTRTRINKDNGNVGIGTTAAPANRLHVASTGTADPVRFENMQLSTSAFERSLVADTNGVVRYSNSSPVSVIAVRLSSVQTIARGAAGTTTGFSNDALVANTIPDASYSAATNSLTIPPGTYIVTVTYEANLAAQIGTDGTVVRVSSYFYDFTTQTGTIRVHSNAAHNSSTQSSHGVTISFVVNYTSTHTVPFNVGWGVGGTVALGTSLIFARGTGISYVRVGN